MTASCGCRRIQSSGGDAQGHHPRGHLFISPAGCTRITPCSGALFIIQADIGAPGQIERVVEMTLARYGRIDVLVNSAAHSLWAGMLDDDRLSASAEQHFHMNVIVPLRTALCVARRFWQGREE